MSSAKSDMSDLDVSLFFYYVCSFIENSLFSCIKSRRNLALFVYICNAISSFLLVSFLLKPPSFGGFIFFVK